MPDATSLSAHASRFLARFPKSQAVLPDPYLRIYEQHMLDNRAAATTATRWSSRLEAWMHRRVAAGGGDRPREKVLEIGAGTLNHMAYEPRPNTYDIVEPFAKLYESSPALPRVRRVYRDLADVEADQRYDAIISIAVLEHLHRLPEIVVRSCGLLAENGVFLVGIPSEGTPMWTLGWRLTTGREFHRTHGLDYGVLMRYEHVNTAWEIEQTLRIFFGHVKVHVFGISRRLSLYQYLECSAPHAMACQDYLERH